jgi:hypothetical protein
MVTGRTAIVARSPRVSPHSATSDCRFLQRGIERGDDPILLGAGEFEHRPLGAKTNPTRLRPADAMLGVSGVVPTNSEARCGYLSDNVVNNVFRHIEDDLDAALARIKRRHSHEEQYAAHGRRGIDRVSGIIGYPARQIDGIGPPLAWSAASSFR